MNIKIKSEELQDGINRIAEKIELLSQRINGDRSPEVEHYVSVVKRLANVEARIEKLENLLTKKTPLGEAKLSERGKEVAGLWYKKD